MDLVPSNPIYSGLCLKPDLLEVVIGDSNLRDPNRIRSSELLCQWPEIGSDSRIPILLTLAVFRDREDWLDLVRDVVVIVPSCQQVGIWWTYPDVPPVRMTG